MHACSLLHETHLLNKLLFIPLSQELMFRSLCLALMAPFTLLASSTSIPANASWITFQAKIYEEALEDYLRLEIIGKWSMEWMLPPFEETFNL